MENDSHTYAVDERLAKARKIRDNALDWLADLAEQRKGKGILAAAELYQRMEDKVQWLKSLGEGGSTGGVVYVMYADD